MTPSLRIFRLILRQKLLHDVCHQFRMTGKPTGIFWRRQVPGRQVAVRQDGCERWDSGGISGGSLGGFFFLFSFFSLYFRMPSAGGFGLNRRWATRYVPSPDECDVIAVLALSGGR